MNETKRLQRRKELEAALAACIVASTAANDALATACNAANKDAFAIASKAANKATRVALDALTANKVANDILAAANDA